MRPDWHLPYPLAYCICIRMTSLSYLGAIVHLPYPHFFNASLLRFKNEFFLETINVLPAALLLYRPISSMTIDHVHHLLHLLSDRFLPFLQLLEHLLEPTWDDKRLVFSSFERHLYLLYSHLQDVFPIVA